MFHRSGRARLPPSQIASTQRLSRSFALPSRWRLSVRAYRIGTPFARCRNGTSDSTRSLDFKQVTHHFASSNFKRPRMIYNPICCRPRSHGRNWVARGRTDAFRRGQDDNSGTFLFDANRPCMGPWAAAGACCGATFWIQSGRHVAGPLLHGAFRGTCGTEIVG